MIHYFEAQKKEIFQSSIDTLLLFSQQYQQDPYLNDPQLPLT